MGLKTHVAGNGTSSWDMEGRSSCVQASEKLVAISMSSDCYFHAMHSYNIMRLCGKFRCCPCACHWTEVILFPASLSSLSSASVIMQSSANCRRATRHFIGKCLLRITFCQPSEYKWIQISSPRTAQEEVLTNTTLS